MSDSPFFVVGNDRSGTTLLRLILDRSREAAVPPESMFLLDFAPVRRRGGLDDHERATRFCAEVWSHPRVRAWGLTGEAPEVPGGLSHEEAYRFAVEAPFRAYAGREGKERFGDKTPAYLFAFDELFAVWPAARAVVLVRDARDVALSVRSVPFGPNNTYTAAGWWRKGVRAGLEAQSRYPEQVLTVRYEDLVRDPETVVQEVCRHVGLGYNTEMLAVEASPPEKVLGSPTGTLAPLEPISADGSGRFEAEMSAEDRRIVESVAGNELRALGYEVGDGALPVGRVQAGAYTAHDAALRAVNVVKLRVLEERGHELGYVLRRKFRALRP